MLMLDGMFKINCETNGCTEHEYFCDTGDDDFKRSMIRRAGWEVVSVDIATKTWHYVCSKCFRKHYCTEPAISFQKVPNNFSKTQRILIPPTIPAFIAKEKQAAQTTEKPKAPVTTINQQFFSLECSCYSNSNTDYLDQCEHGWGYGC